jgi:hypothetical protein
VDAAVSRLTHTARPRGWLPCIRIWCGVDAVAAVSV